jgi:hypothetical protein
MFGFWVSRFNEWWGGFKNVKNMGKNGENETTGKRVNALGITGFDAVELGYWLRRGQNALESTPNRLRTLYGLQKGQSVRTRDSDAVPATEGSKCTRDIENSTGDGRTRDSVVFDGRRSTVPKTRRTKDVLEMTTVPKIRRTRDVLGTFKTWRVTDVP